MKSLKQKRPRNERTTQQKDDKQNCLLRPHLRSWNPMGMWLGKHSSFSPSSFFSFFFFFCFFLPLLAPLIPLWWSCGSTEGSGAAGISPGHKAPWEEQTLARQREEVPWKWKCCALRRLSVHAYTQECCHTRLIKNFKEQKKMWS